MYRLLGIQAAEDVSASGLVQEASDISAVAGFVDNCWVCRQLLGL